MSVKRGAREPMYEYVCRWCRECREREKLMTGELDVDMSRHAMVLTPAEYCEFLQDARLRTFNLSRPTRLFGVAIVAEL